MHLYDRDKHDSKDVPTWEDALKEADNGDYVNLAERSYEAWFDGDGNETDLDIKASPSKGLFYRVVSPDGKKASVSRDVKDASEPSRLSIDTRESHSRSRSHRSKSHKKRKKQRERSRSRHSSSRGASGSRHGKSTPVQLDMHPPPGMPMAGPQHPPPYGYPVPYGYQRPPMGPPANPGVMVPSMQLPVAQVVQEAGGRFIRLSAVELEELIDGCSRCAQAAQHTAALCEQAAQGFRNEASTLNSCKSMFEKNRRNIM